MLNINPYILGDEWPANKETFVRPSLMYAYTLDGPGPLVLSAAAGMGPSIMTVRQDRETANYWGLAAMQQLKAGLEFRRVRLFFPVFDVRYPFFSVESGYSERYSTGLSAELMVAF